jgi:hypothetical protein
MHGWSPHLPEFLNGFASDEQIMNELLSGNISVPSRQIAIFPAIQSQISERPKFVENC